MKLVLLRHGESKWNLENKFTGWTDVELTEKGEAEAKNAGKLINNENINIDLVFTWFVFGARRRITLNCFFRIQFGFLQRSDVSNYCPSIFCRDRSAITSH